MALCQAPDTPDSSNALYIGILCKARVKMEVKLSSKNQIVIPREAREALGATAGTRILVVVRNSTVILTTKPDNYATAIRGLAKPYPRIYLKKERESW